MKLTTNMDIRAYHEKDKQQVVDLWKLCSLIVPANDPERDIALKLQVQRDLFLVGVVDGCVVATIMAGYEGHRGWLNYLAVAPRFQGQGWGRRMVEEAERRLRELGCPKINLQIRTSNTSVIGFYEHIGFKIDDVISMGKRL